MIKWKGRKGRGNSPTGGGNRAPTTVLLELLTEASHVFQQGLGYGVLFQPLSAGILTLGVGRVHDTPLATALSRQGLQP